MWCGQWQWMGCAWMCGVGVGFVGSFGLDGIVERSGRVGGVWDGVPKKCMLPFISVQHFLYSILYGTDSRNHKWAVIS